MFRLLGALDTRTGFSYNVLARVVRAWRDMHEFLSSVSQKGQITLSPELRRQLGIKPKGKVTLQLDGDAVRVVPATFTLRQVFGSVGPDTDTERFKQAEREAREERAEQEARTLRGETVRL
jgi:bifunctional DNA-binding transcriptional regulator/antitoxin component of YhaV-PrlF toxin-antitoxin module